MADRRALVAGTTAMLAEINGADTLEVATGGLTSSSGPLVLDGATSVVQVNPASTLDAATIDRAGTISIGATSGTSITIGRSGQLTTVAGNLSVSGTETVVGTTTFQDDVNLGNDPTDTVDFGGGSVTSTGNPTWDFGTGQADFGGNLDANAGLDVSGAAFSFTGTAGSWTIALADSALTQTGSGNVTVTGNLRGADDGTGLVVGHAGTGASTGSALQIVGVTTTERGYLVPANGMLVYNSTDTELQAYVSGSWETVGTGFDPTGTPNLTWTVNDDATTAATEEAAVILTSSTTSAGGSVVTGQWTLRDDDGDPVLYYKAFDNASARTDTTVVIGHLDAVTTNAEARLYWNSGDGTAFKEVEQRLRKIGADWFFEFNATVSGVDFAFRDDVIFDGVVKGTNDGTGLVVGNAGTGASEGSTLQIVSLTSTERGYLVPAAGMWVWNSTAVAMQWYDGTSWQTVPTATSAGGWTDDGTVVRLTTATDDVAIGIATMLGTEKLRVVGDVSVQGDLDFESGADRNVNVLQAAVDTAGDALTVNAGKGGNYSAAAPGAGGQLISDGGSGGDSALASGTAGTGGAGNFRGGAGGTATGTTSTGGTGGDAFVAGGAGGTGTSANGPGGAARVRGGSGATLGAVYIGDSSTSQVNIGSSTTPTLVTVPDNTASAFKVQEGTNDYITVTTTDSSEQAIIGNGAVTNLQTVLLGASVDLGSPASPAIVTVSIADNASSFTVKQSSDEYISVDTTNGSELITLGNTTTDPIFRFFGNGGIQGDNDGTGLVIGHAGTGASTGSTLQVVSLTSTERGYLVPAAGMWVWNSTAVAMQWYDGTSWQTVPTATSAGGWTDDGTVVRLTTATDDVAIGIATMLGTEKLRVVGDVSVQGDLLFETGATRDVKVIGAAVDTAGNDLNVNGGRGGDYSASAAGAGGQGVFAGGDGGDTALAADTAGAGGTGNLVGGDGGDATAGTGTGGAGGNAIIVGGIGGTGVTANGVGGTVFVRGGSGATDGGIIIADQNTSSVAIGNATDNPPVNFNGTGTVALTGTGQKLELSADGYIGIDERGTDPTTGSNEGAIYTKDDAGTTQLFYRASGSGTVYQITPPAAANPEYTGTAAETIAAGEPVCVQWDAGNTEPRVYLTDANVTGRSNGIGLATNAATAGNSVTVQLAGESATLPDAVWDTVPTTTAAGTAVWMSETQGNLTTTKPTGAATVQQFGWVSEVGTGATKIIIDTSVQLKVA